MSERQRYRRESTTPSYHQMVKTEAHPDLLPYPIDMSPLLALPLKTVDETETLCNSPQGNLPPVYDPTSIAQYALVNWNAYLTDGDAEYREKFTAYADWLLAHKSVLSNGTVGWPVPSSSNAQGGLRPCLSALTQGNAISVLLRAYQLTDNDTYLEAVQQAVNIFELDILDGGVSASIGNKGVFFEELAIYPAAHVLSAHILAIFGLYDYVACTRDSKIEALIQQSVDTLHVVLDEFDVGYWTRSDLIHKDLASMSGHSLHVTLLEALARYSDCGHCSMVAKRWMSYQHNLRCRLRYLASNYARTFYDQKLKPRLRCFIFHAVQENKQPLSTRVCIPITAFPVAGGMRGVLTGVASVMRDRWKIVYLTHHKGRESEGMEIEIFGRKGAAPWQFPFVWLYCIAGWVKLFTLLRRGAGYDLILPQDGVFTGAFSALVGKIAGVRVVCMDHGNVTLLDSPTFRSERLGPVKTYPWYRRVLARLQWALYWPSQRLLARIATRYTDQFLVAGDEVEAIYREQLGVHPSRIIRYAYMLDAGRFTPPDEESRARMRAEHGVPEDAIVIILNNRLAPEKGLDLAIEGLARALSGLSADRRARVKVLLAGDGPLRLQVQADIRRYGLDSICSLLGEATPSDVVSLLAISDIFLYCGTRGTNYSMAVLEAMAAGCAVIASTRPLSNRMLLAEGRGIAISAENVEQIVEALVQLVNDPELCSQMSCLARNYVTTEHNASMLRRALIRATYWSALHEFLDNNESVVVSES